MTQKNLLLVFVRNPKLGKVKTRLAKSIGDAKALAVYEFLLQHTFSITSKANNCDKQVWYSDFIDENDLWKTPIFDKKCQEGTDLGDRLQRAFKTGFESGYERIVVLGSDLFEITAKEIEAAFEALENHDAVVGPAKDGGYYLFGTRRYLPHAFSNIDWGSEKVMQQTLEQLKGQKYSLLAVKNDIDYLEDIIDIAAFAPFLK